MSCYSFLFSLKNCVPVTAKNRVRVTVSSRVRVRVQGSSSEPATGGTISRSLDVYILTVPSPQNSGTVLTVP